MVLLYSMETSTYEYSNEYTQHMPGSLVQSVARKINIYSLCVAFYLQFCATYFLRDYSLPTRQLSVTGESMFTCSRTGLLLNCLPWNGVSNVITGHSDLHTQRMDLDGGSHQSLDLKSS